MNGGAGSTSVSVYAAVDMCCNRNRHCPLRTGQTVGDCAAPCPGMPLQGGSSKATIETRTNRGQPDMHRQGDTGLAAIPEPPIEHRAGDKADLFLQPFEMAMRIERERLRGILRLRRRPAEGPGPASSELDPQAPAMAAVRELPDGPRGHLFAGSLEALAFARSPRAGFRVRPRTNVSPPPALPLTRGRVLRQMAGHGSPLHMPSMGEHMGMWCGRPKPGPKATAAPATVSGERSVNQPLGNREGDGAQRPASQETSHAPTSTPRRV